MGAGFVDGPTGTRSGKVDLGEFLGLCAMLNFKPPDSRLLPAVFRRYDVERA